VLKMTDARRMKSTVRKTARGDTLSHRQGSQAGGSVLEPRGKDTRQRIIVAVWEALAQHGYAKLTVRLVGETAGVSHAMIHYYFATKDDLLLAVVEQARGNWIHPLEDYVFGPGSSLDKLDNIIVWMAEPATREVMRVHRQLLSQSEWNEDLRQAMATEYARWRSGFTELFRQLERDDFLTPNADIQLLAAAFSITSDSLVGKRALEPGLDSEAIMREMLRPFLRVSINSSDDDAVAR
jgi:AcrR family transcriptional regulator